MSSRAIRWGLTKTAGWSYPGGPLRSDFGDFEENEALAGILQSHFPVQYAREQIQASKNISFQDRVRMLGAVNAAAGATTPSGNTVEISKYLPAAVGAGVGLLGAALTVPIFGFTPLQKKFYGIGAGALGAVLNTYGRD